MPTLAEIEIQVKNLGSIQGFLGKKEIKELPNILWENENVENIIQGTYNNGNGILVGTNKRLIFVDKGLIFGLKVEDFPYEKISSTQYQTGLLFGKLTIFTSGNKAIIDNVPILNVRTFGDWVRNKISNPPQSETAQNTTTNIATVDIADQIEKLGKLREKGLLSDEEFNTQKKKLLDL